MYALKRQQVKNSYDLIERVPKDRLQYLADCFRARDIIRRDTMFLDVVASIPDEYTLDDLKVIHGHLCESARCVLELMEHFLDRVKHEMDANPFAV